MSLREFISIQEKKGSLVRIKKEVSKELVASGIIKQLEPRPVIFENVKNSSFQIVSNIFSSKKLAAEFFGINETELIPRLIDSIENPTNPNEIENAACTQNTMKEVDLDKVPILTHCEKDGGAYISSAVFFSYDSEYGQNLSFHRGMQISKNKFALRILQRNLNTFLERQGKVKVACCIGLPLQVLLAGATSVKLGKNELTIANSLKNLNVTKMDYSNTLVPSETEFVLEGYIDKEELHSEGPFVDLTETYDVVREQPVFTVEKIHYRNNAMYHALLPGALEHKFLMGTPREPTIFKEVNKVANCTDVSITPGGCSWLHAIVKINKQNEDEPKKAIEAAFNGHKSLKHCYIVDEDIDIYNHLDVEWALATRFQADKRLIIKEKQKGSSLDPSANPTTRETTKVGFDLTKPCNEKGKEFERANFPKVDLRKYLR